MVELFLLVEMSLVVSTTIVIRFLILDQPFFEKLLQIIEHFPELLPTDSADSERALEEGCLLTNFGVLVPQKLGSNLKDFVVDHFVCCFLVVNVFI